MVFDKCLSRRRCLLEVENGTYQALQKDRRPGFSLRVLANHGAERRAGGITTNHEFSRINAKRRSVSGHPLGCGDRIPDSSWKFVLGSETVPDGYEATASGLGEPGADAVVSVDT